MLDLLRDSVHQRHQGNIGQDVRTKMEERLDELLARPPVYTMEDGKETELDKLKKSIAKHRDHVFTFLTNPAVPPTNNDSEKALRPAKTKLEVSGCFRRLAWKTTPPSPPSYRRRSRTGRTLSRPCGSLRPSRRHSIIVSIIISRWAWPSDYGRGT